MTYVIIRSYSRFYDQTTGTAFEPVMDQAAGVWIGAASVAPKLVKSYFGPKAAFEVLSDADYFALITPAPPEDGPDPVMPLTGTPLTDQSLVTTNGGPHSDGTAATQTVAPPEPPGSAPPELPLGTPENA